MVWDTHVNVHQDINFNRTARLVRKFTHAIEKTTVAVLAYVRRMARR